MTIIIVLISIYICIHDIMYIIKLLYMIIHMECMYTDTSAILMYLHIIRTMIIMYMYTGNLNDPLAVAYQLVLDNRVVNQAAHDALTTTSHEPVQSISPPNTHGYIL